MDLTKVDLKQLFLNYYKAKNHGTRRDTPENNESNALELIELLHEDYIIPKNDDETYDISNISTYDTTYEYKGNKFIAKEMQDTIILFKNEQAVLACRVYESNSAQFQRSFMIISGHEEVVVYGLENGDIAHIHTR